MPSIFALRAALVAALGLGTADLVWLDAGLGPRALGPHPVAVAVAAAAEPVPAIAPPAHSPPATRPPVVEDARVYFATASAELAPATRPALHAIAARAAGGAAIALEGHADFRGEGRLNRELSKQRAAAVRAYLVELGVPSAQIQVGYAGAAAPAAVGQLWRDRRVEIQITGGSR